MFLGFLLFTTTRYSHLGLVLLYITSRLNPRLFLMKIFAIVLSIIVGIVSVLLFKEHILETASVLYNSVSDSISSITSTAMTDSAPQEQQQQSTTPPANMSVPRAIRKAFLAVEQAEGAGARVRRSIGTPQLENFSPFLMLDHFSVKPGAGFPDHPHRGQEV